MTTAANKGNVKFEDHAGLALDQRLRRGTRRTTRPRRTRFKAWRVASGPALEIDFVGRRPVQGHVRSVLVVPGAEVIEFAPERSLCHWDDG